MCKIHNLVGSITSIKRNLSKKNIDDLNTLNEILAFRDSYQDSRQRTISECRGLVIKEKEKLHSDVVLLQNEISNDKLVAQQKLKSKIDQCNQQVDKFEGADKSYIGIFVYSFKVVFLLIKIKFIEFFFNLIVNFSVRSKVKMLALKSDRLNYLTINFDEEVERVVRQALYELDRKKIAIDEMNNLIYGAIGEQKVVDELKRLSNDNILINDFCYTFERPLYYKEQKTRISTIQIDHILVSPAGVFLIETKNWSNQSLQSLDLRSPVEQIRRASFALFILLNRTADLKLVPHHWGERKIPVKNLIVMINHKPNAEFQYVKVLTLSELLSHIMHFKPSLSRPEVQEIADYLISIGAKV